jgi:polygalacturonase
MIFICECENIIIKDTLFRNSPYWHCLLHGCVNIMVERLTVRGDRRILNNDGIDIDCCENAVIRNCDFETGDDCIAIRGNDAPLVNKRPCQGVYVSDCRLSCNYASGIRVGVGSGLIRNCRFENLKITGTTGLCLCTGWWTPHYVTIHDILFKDVEMAIDSSLYVAPKVLNGNLQKVQIVLEELDMDAEWDGVKYSKRDSIWGSTRSDSTTVTIKAGDYITPGLVPNVVGMGAQDALYLLESVGLKVKINGVGRVRQQSLRAGTRFNSGSTIVLTLRM